MNERIRELALQAEKLKRDEVSYRERLHNRYLTGDMEEEIFREKFAQLIVGDCLEQVRDEVQYEYDWKLADAVSERVKKHFGVE